MSCQSLLSDNKDYNEVKSGDMHRSSGIYFKTEENPGKPQPGKRLKAV